MLVIGVGVLLGGVALAARTTRPKTSDLPVLGQVPAFTMPDQTGRMVSDESLRGQVLVVDFFYASCTSSCPKLTGRMLAVQDAIASREIAAGRSLPVHLISITLDPANDTPDVLAAYAGRVGADPLRWSFLSGRSEDLNRVVVSGFKYSFERADPSAGIGAIMHGEWLVLVDATGALRGYYAASDSERMSALAEDTARLALAAPLPATPEAPSPRTAEAPGQSQPPKTYHAASDSERMSALAEDTARLALAAPLPATPEAPSPRTAEAPGQSQPPKTYHAVGAIRSFGPARSFVNIAHEDIPGYMAAMTMAFEPKNPGQLDGLAEKDRVQFDFVETADARRVLVQITKQR